LKMMEYVINYTMTDIQVRLDDFLFQ